MEKISQFKETGYPTIAGRKILFFVNDYDTLKMHRKSLIEHLVELGVDLHIATPEPKEDETFLPPKKEVNLHKLQLSRKGKNPFQDLLTMQQFYRLAKEIKPDLVHNFSIKPVIYGSFAARRAKVPAIFNTITGLGHAFVDDSIAGVVTRELVCALYRNAFRAPQVRVIFQNPDDLHIFEEAGILRGKMPVMIPGSGVNPEAFKPTTTPRNPDAPCKIIFAGRMLWTKGLGELAEALALLKKDPEVNCELHLYGSLDDGNPAAIPKFQIEDWQKRKLLTWHGASEDMAASIQESDIACLPSYREGISRFLLEAGACEKAVVTTDAPGGRDIVQHEVNGLLVTPKDSRSLAVALRRLILAPELRERFGKKGREIILEKFTEKRINDMVVETYRNS